MKMFEVSRLEEDKYQTYLVLAGNEDEALDRTFDEDVYPLHEAEAQKTSVKPLPDCTCGICHTHGYPWACQHADPEDYVLDIGGGTFEEWN